MKGFKTIQDQRLDQKAREIMRRIRKFASAPGKYTDADRAAAIKRAREGL